MKTQIKHDFGYGIIPKSIMRSKLSIQAKSIYSYLASFAGNTGKSFPSVKLICSEMGISKDTFYKYIKELKEYGVVTVIQERNEKGVFTRSIYYLSESPINVDEVDESIEIEEEIDEIELCEPCPKSPCTVTPCPKSPYTVNKDTISNSISKSNSSNNNNSLILSLFEHWNDKNIVKHRKVTKKITTAINAALKDYTEQEILNAIDNYNEILKDDKYYFNYAWSLQDFLKRGIDKFIDLEIAKNNYSNNKGVKSNGRNERNNGQFVDKSITRL